MAKFHFNFISKDSSFKLTPNDLKTYAALHPEHYITADFIESNVQPLGKIYNSLFDKYKNMPKEQQWDFLVLMHADVFLDVAHFINHIIECQEKYDVFGLCGTEVLNISNSPLNWFTGSAQTPNKRWGCVTHGELGNQTSFFSQDRRETTDHSVGCIDGLCMVFNQKAIESGIQFNEQLRFNCYDTQISLDALMNKKLQLGVIVEESLQHFSVGKSILEKDFLIDEFVLRKQFDFPIPENVSSAVPQ